MERRTNILITSLVLVIVVLAGIMVYSFLIKPKISGYTTQKQTEGIQIAILNILSQIQQRGYAQIPVGNQTLYLAPFNPQQLQQQQAAQTQAATP